MDSSVPHRTHGHWREQQNFVLAGCQMQCSETGTIELVKDRMCQRSYIPTVSSRSSRGLRGICIALRNNGKVDKSLQCGRHARPGRVSEEVYALAMLLDSARRHTILELARAIGLAHSEATLGRQKNCIPMDSAWFNGNAEMTTTQRCSKLFGARKRCFVTPNYYAGGYMVQIVRATIETPIERMASLRVTTKIGSSS